MPYDWEQSWLTRWVCKRISKDINQQQFTTWPCWRRQWKFWKVPAVTGYAVCCLDVCPPASRSANARRGLRTIWFDVGWRAILIGRILVLRLWWTVRSSRYLFGHKSIILVFDRFSAVVLCPLRLSVNAIHQRIACHPISTQQQANLVSWYISSRCILPCTLSQGQTLVYSVEWLVTTTGLWDQYTVA